MDGEPEEELQLDDPQLEEEDLTGGVGIISSARASQAAGGAGVERV